MDVVTETVIDRPRAEVAEYASDPDNVPRWYVNIHSVEWKRALSQWKPPTPGSRSAKARPE